MIASERLVTLAIHTYDRGVKLKQILEHYGIEAVINNVNLIRQSFSSAVRVRICEKDLSRALQITEGKSLDDLYLSISEMECEEKMKILIPVDFSESSIKECQIGFDLAERFNAEVVLLHSFLGSNQGGGLLFRGNSYKMLDIITAKEDVDTKFEAVDKMEELIDKLNILVANGNLPNINFIFEISQGVPEVVIMDAAKRLNPMLIIMGASNQNKKEANLLGSVTAEVVDAAKYTVLTLPEWVDVDIYNNIRNVALFTDLDQNDLSLFESFINRFKNMNMSITLVGISNTEGDSQENCLKSKTEACKIAYPDLKFSYKSIIAEYYLTSFDRYLHSAGIDLIVIPNKKRNIISRLLSSSMAQRVLFNSDIPILVIPY